VEAPDVSKSPLSIVRESPSNSSASASTVKEKVSRRSPPKEDLPQRELTASPQDARELLYGPGGLFGPKGPFSTPNVRYPHGLEVGLASSPKRNVHFEHHPSRAQLASRCQFCKTFFVSPLAICKIIMYFRLTFIWQTKLKIPVYDKHSSLFCGMTKLHVT
jgi:hypothetical protein